MTLLEKFSRIKVFAFDVDGVLTDGNLHLMDNGEQVRRMNIKDGFALQLAIKKGYRIIIISGSYSEPSITRLNKLGIPDIYMRITDKASCLENYLQEAGRAGRDRDHADCVLLYAAEDVERQFSLSARSRLARHEMLFGRQIGMGRSSPSTTNSSKMGAGASLRPRELPLADFS